MLPSDDQPSHIRFAVFSAATEGKLLGKLLIPTRAGGEWQLEKLDISDAEVEKITLLLGHQRAKFEAENEGTMVPFDSAHVADLVTALSDAGFATRELPLHDLSLTVRIDSETGRILAENELLHEFGIPNHELARSIVQMMSTTAAELAIEAANAINDAVENGDDPGAVSALKSGRDKGALNVPARKELLDALQRINVAALGADDRRMVRDCRLLLAERLKLWIVAGDEAEQILREAETLSDEWRASLQLAIANGAFERGNKESGLLILRRLLKEPELLNASTRGWAWRNLSLSLPDDDPETIRVAQYSSDAFIEAGSKTEAARSLARCFACLEHREPTAALDMVDRTLAIPEEGDLDARAFRAAGLHQRALLLSKLGRHSESYVSARQAVDASRGLIGTEIHLTTYLYLAAAEADALGLSSEAEAFRAEARGAAAAARTTYFEIIDRITALMSSYEQTTYEALFAEVQASKNRELISTLSVAHAVSNRTLSDERRVELLEEAIQVLEEEGARAEVKRLAQGAIASVLTRLQQGDRAAHWYRALLRTDPYDLTASGSLVKNLWDRNEWSAAAEVIDTQLELRGDQPGLLLAYGKSLCHATKWSEAATALLKCMQHPKVDENTKTNADALLRKALAAGGEIAVADPAVLENRDPRTLRDFEMAIEDFSSHIASDGRKQVWTWDDARQRKWIRNPESLAQRLFHAFLRGRFGKEHLIFTELESGAGFVDFFVQLKGGATAIVETKMCGAPSYSSTYASEGEGQLLHYMRNRESHFGCLLVFDARIRDFGQSVLRINEPKFTIIERFVDVRPDVIPESEV